MGSCVKWLFLRGLGCELVNIFHSTGKLPKLNRNNAFGETKRFFLLGLKAL